jgi:hypothetical protein
LPSVHRKDYLSVFGATLIVSAGAGVVTTGAGIAWIGAAKPPAHGSQQQSAALSSCFFFFQGCQPFFSSAGLPQGSQQGSQVGVQAGAQVGWQQQSAVGSWPVRFLNSFLHQLSFFSSLHSQPQQSPQVLGQQVLGQQVLGQQVVVGQQLGAQQLGLQGAGVQQGAGCSQQT